RSERSGWPTSSARSACRRSSERQDAARGGVAGPARATVERFMPELGDVLRKVFGSRNERTIKALLPLVQRINELEPETCALSDEALRAKTTEFRERLKKGESLDDLLPEAFAAVREAGKRTLGMRPFDVQLIGGIVLHRGMIAEMATGEGKTFVAT